MKKTYTLKSKRKENIKALKIRNITQIEIGIMIHTKEEILEGSVVLIQDEKDKDGWHILGIKQLGADEIDDDLSSPEDIDALKEHISKELAKMIKTNRAYSMVWDMARIDSKNPFII